MRYNIYMTIDQLRHTIQTFVTEHKRFPSQTDIPDLPSLRTLQRHGIHISDFLETKTSSPESVNKMKESTYKLSSAVHDLAVLLRSKKMNPFINYRIGLIDYTTTNLFIEEKRIAIEVVSPSSKLSVPTTLRRRLFKYPFHVLDTVAVVYILNVNDELDITYYKPRRGINPKIKIMNLKDFKLLWNNN